MEIKGPYLSLLLLTIALSSCTTSPASPTSSLSPPSSLPAPEISETLLTKPANPEEQPATAKALQVAQPPLLSNETIDCVLNLLIEKDCAGFILDGAAD